MKYSDILFRNINWYDLSHNEELSEDFIREYANKIN